MILDVVFGQRWATHGIRNNINVHPIFLMMIILFLFTMALLKIII